MFVTVYHCHVIDDWHGSTPETHSFPCAEVITDQQYINL